MLKPKKPSDVEFLKILVYGAPGAGKTVFSATAQDHVLTKNALMISAEAGTLSIRDKNLDVVEPETIQEFTEIFEWVAAHSRYRQQYEEDPDNKEALKNLQKLHYDFHGEKAKKPTLYRTVIIDNITEVNTYASYQVLGVEQDTIETDPNIEAQRDWGKIKKIVEKIVRSFKNLPISVIMTAHKTEDGQGDNMITKPAVTGSLKNALPGFFDIVGLLRTLEEPDKNGKTNKDTVINRYLLVQGTDNYIAKDRSDSLGKAVKNPTVPKIVEKVLLDKKSSKSAVKDQPKA